MNAVHAVTTSSSHTRQKQSIYHVKKSLVLQVSFRTLYFILNPDLSYANGRPIFLAIKNVCNSHKVMLKVVLCYDVLGF